MREMLTEVVEMGFVAGELLQLLSDNGSAYIAHETRRIARSPGLTPVTTPVRRLKGNGTAESLVDTFRRNCPQHASTPTRHIRIQA